jgi:hypothetical protein
MNKILAIIVISGYQFLPDIDNIEINISICFVLIYEFKVYITLQVNNITSEIWQQSDRINVFIISCEFLKKRKTISYVFQVGVIT